LRINVTRIVVTFKREGEKDTSLGAYALHPRYIFPDRSIVRCSSNVIRRDIFSRMQMMVFPRSLSPNRELGVGKSPALSPASAHHRAIRKAGVRFLTRIAPSRRERCGSLRIMHNDSLSSRPRAFVGKRAIREKKKSSRARERIAVDRNNASRRSLRDLERSWYVVIHVQTPVTKKLIFHSERENCVRKNILMRLRNL